MNKPLVYLAGPIKFLTYDEASEWREQARDLFEAYGILVLSPMRGKEYLKSVGVIDGDYPQALSTQAAITARDRFDVQRCDLVLFNFLGASVPSVGTCIEVGWADAFRKPAVMCLEENTDNPHDHPMVRQVCGWRATSLDAAVDLAARILLP